MSATRAVPVTLPSAFWANVKLHAIADGHFWLARMAEFLERHRDDRADTVVAIKS